MDHEILFRGKRLDNGEWAQGDVCNDYFKIGDTCISERGCFGFVQVDPDTIGQYTGLTDKNGVRIFEGDIAQYDDELVVVEWDDGDAMFYIRSQDGTNWITNFSEISGGYLEVIGNIHDNPELLKGGTAS